MEKKVKNKMRATDWLQLCFFHVWKHKGMIMMITILSALIGILYVSFQPVTNTYITTVVLQDISFETDLTLTKEFGVFYRYADLVKCRKVCERAEAMVGDPELTASEIQDMILYELNEANSIMTVTVQSDRPSTCVKVANAVAESFVLEMEQNQEANLIKIVDNAEKANAFRNGYALLLQKIAITAVIGFVVSCMYYMFTVLFSKTSGCRTMC